MFAATFYDVYKHREFLHGDDLGMFAAGSVAAFFSALMAIRGFIRYVSHHDFTLFAWYRIGFGLVVLLTAYFGVVNWTTD